MQMKQKHQKNLCGHDGVPGYEAPNIAENEKTGGFEPWYLDHWKCEIDFLVFFGQSLPDFHMECKGRHPTSLFGQKFDLEV